MLVDDADAFIPCSCSWLYAAQLPGQDGVEPVEMLLCPFDTSARHQGGETLLVDVDGVLEDGEINE